MNTCKTCAAVAYCTKAYDVQRNKAGCAYYTPVQTAKIEPSAEVKELLDNPPFEG